MSLNEQNKKLYLSALVETLYYSFRVIKYDERKTMKNEENDTILFVIYKDDK